MAVREQMTAIMSAPSPPFALRRTAKIIALSVFLAIAVLICFAPIETAVLRLFSDDAYYYIEIARRMGNGQGSTWDGITQTNGYHPLWLLLLVPLTPLFNTLPEAGVRVVCLLDLGLLGAAVWTAYRSVQRIAPHCAWVGFLYVWMLISFASLYGVEAPLLALLAALLFNRVLQIRAPLTYKQAGWLGLLTSLLFLARIDSLLYIVALDAVLLARTWQTRREQADRTPLALCLLLQALVVGGYFLSNLLLFHHLLTISATIKADRRAGLSLIWLRNPLAITGFLSVPTGWLALRQCRVSSTRALLWSTSLGSTLYALAMLVSGTPETRVWYFTLPVLCFGVHISVLGENLAGKPRALRLFLHTGFVLAMLALPVTLVGKFVLKVARREYDNFAAQYVCARWVARHAPPDAVFARTDCGLFGYFARRSVLNTDGLTSDFSYRAALNANRVSEWLQKHGLNTLVFPAEWQPQQRLGEFFLPVAASPNRQGHYPALYAGVVPLPTTESAPPFRLWRVVTVREGLPSAPTVSAASSNR